MSTKTRIPVILNIDNNYFSRPDSFVYSDSIGLKFLNGTTKKPLFYAEIFANGTEFGISVDSATVSFDSENFDYLAENIRDELKDIGGSFKICCSTKRALLLSTEDCNRLKDVFSQCQRDFENRMVVYKDSTDPMELVDGLFTKLSANIQQFLGTLSSNAFCADTQIDNFLEDLGKRLKQSPAVRKIFEAGLPFSEAELISILVAERTARENQKKL